MTKFMRKYQKWLLAVFGSALMVVFLVQGVMGSMHGDQGARTFATLDGKSMSFNRRAVSDGRYAAINHVVPGFMGQFGVQDEDHWFLLSYAAKAGGFTGHAGDGLDYQQELAEVAAAQFFRGLSFEDQIRLMQDSNLQQQVYQARVSETLRLMKTTGAPEDRLSENTEQGFNLALADLRGVIRMLTASGSATKMSDRAAYTALAQQDSAIVVDAIVLNAEPLTATVPAPTPEEMEAQFQKAREADPAKAADGFGYVLPPRVKVEWIAVEKSALASVVKLDDIEVNKKWRQSRTTYPGEFTVEKPRVIADLTEAEVTRLMSETDRAIKSQVTLGIKDLPELDGYRTLPENWASVKPSLASIAVKAVEVVKAATGVTIPTPKVESRDTWMTSEALQTLPGIGGSQLQLGTSAAPFSQLAMQVRELKPARSVAAIQVGVPFTAAPLQNMAGDHFTFLVTEAKDTAPADSLEEVRAQVDHDVRAIKAYQKIASNIEAYKALAVSDGLEAVGKLSVEGTVVPAPSPRLQVRIPKDESRRNDPDLGAKDVAEAVWAVGGSLDPLAEITPDTLAARTVVVARPDARKVVVAKILQNRPLTLEAVRRLQPQNMMELQRREVRESSNESFPNAYEFASLASRLKYEPVDSQVKNKNKKK